MEILKRMYTKWCEKNQWNIKTIEMCGEPTIRRYLFEVYDPSAKMFFKNESGVHKLTRVSPYGNGKKHTSCVALSVCQFAKEASMILDEKNLKWDTFRGTGPGGQHRNKRDTAVRLTYLPTDRKAHV